MIYFQSLNFTNTPVARSDMICNKIKTSTTKTKCEECKGSRWRLPSHFSKCEIDEALLPEILYSTILLCNIILSVYVSQFECREHTVSAIIASVYFRKQKHRYSVLHYKLLYQRKKFYMSTYSLTIQSHQVRAKKTK